MRAQGLLCTCLAAGMLICGVDRSEAVEYTLGLYALGTGAVGAGITPPVGVYLTDAFSYTQYQTSKQIPFAGTTLVGKVYIPATTVDILAVLPQTFLGGHISLSGSTGYGNMQLNASAFGPFAFQQSTNGWGMTDSSVRASIGWEVNPTFSHKLSITGYLPTGLYSGGFNPFLGLNRPGVDISWGATYIDPTTKIELSGTAGFTYEGYNITTFYSSGNAVHFEEGLSKYFDKGFRAGIISYQYLQISDDSGAGAVLGPFRTDFVGVGPSFGWTTEIAGHAVSFNAQATRDVAFVHRLQATTGIFATTLKF
jgi:hypothetical protein